MRGDEGQGRQVNLVGGGGAAVGECAVLAERLL